jgi:hypothetical protein
LGWAAAAGSAAFALYPTNAAAGGFFPEDRRVTSASQRCLFAGTCVQVRCRYLLRVTVTGKGMTQDSRRDFNIWVTNYEEPSDAAAPIKVGPVLDGVCPEPSGYMP